MADYEDIKVKDLVINNMSQEKFDELKAAGELQPDQIYFTPESDGASGDYLPLSGGTIKGMLTIEYPEKADYSLTYVPMLGFKIQTSGVMMDRVIKINADGNVDMDKLGLTNLMWLTPTVSGVISVGSSSKKWKTVYSTMLNNGADIAIPTEGGTLARLEDLEGLGGLPDQTDNAGKFLTTDGTTASWSDKPLVNSSSKSNAIAVGANTTADGIYATAFGINANASKQSSVAIGANSSTGNNAIAIGIRTKATGNNSIQLGGNSYAADTTNPDANTFKVGNANGNFELMDANGNVPRERLKNLVEVLPTEDNGYVTVKNYGNGYVEITGYTAVGTVGASTGSEVQIDLPAGYTMADTNYWVNIAPTSETTMFDFKAEAKARSTTHFMVAYKNEDETTGLTAAGVYWEVRGMLATA